MTILRVTLVAAAAPVLASCGGASKQPTEKVELERATVSVK